MAFKKILHIFKDSREIRNHLMLCGHQYKTINSPEGYHDIRVVDASDDTIYFKSSESLKGSGLHSLRGSFWDSVKVESDCDFRADEEEFIFSRQN